jgi:hypothetical protein
VRVDRSSPSRPWISIVGVLGIRHVEPLAGRSVRLTLTDGSVVERDLSDLLSGPVFRSVLTDDAVFRQVHVDGGTIAWPGDVDMAPETLIWDGPYPPDGAHRRPEAVLRPKRPRY